MSSASTESSTDSILEDLPFALAKSVLSFRQFNKLTLTELGLEDLAPGLASVLHAAEQLGECTINSLVETTHLPNGTLTGLLDTLERDKLIERKRNPEDGRSRIIKLTNKGQLLCNKLHTRHQMAMETFRKSLSSKEMSDLVRLLEKATRCMRNSGNGER